MDEDAILDNTLEDHYTTATAVVYFMSFPGNNNRSKYFIRLSGNNNRSNRAVGFWVPKSFLTV